MVLFQDRRAILSLVDGPLPAAVTATLTEGALIATIKRVWDDELHLLDNAENVATWIEDRLDMTVGNTTDLADAIADGVKECFTPFDRLLPARAAASVMRCLRSGGWLT